MYKNNDNSGILAMIALAVDRRVQREPPKHTTRTGNETWDKRKAFAWHVSRTEQWTCVMRNSEIRTAEDCPCSSYGTRKKIKKNISLCVCIWSNLYTRTFPLVPSFLSPLFVARILIRVSREWVCVCARAVELKKIEFVRAPHTILSMPTIIWLGSCILSFCLRFCLTPWRRCCWSLNLFFFLSLVARSREAKKKYVSSRRRWNVPANLMLGCIHKMLTTNSYVYFWVRARVSTVAHTHTRTHVLSLLDQQHSITQPTEQCKNTFKFKQDRVFARPSLLLAKLMFFSRRFAWPTGILSMTRCPITEFGPHKMEEKKKTNPSKTRSQMFRRLRDFWWRQCTVGTVGRIGRLFYSSASASNAIVGVSDQCWTVNSRLAGTGSTN